MTAVFDHALWGAPDLDQGVEEIASLFGVRPAYGGEHPGLGTRNALLAAGDNLYFEVIAPDPAQTTGGLFSEVLASLPRGELFAFAVRRDGLADMAQAADALELPTTGVQRKARTAPDGTRIEWDMLVMDSPFGTALPFAIDWRGSRHPSEITPKGCTIRSFRVAHPQAGTLRDRYGKLGIDVPVVTGTVPEFLLEIDTPNGAAVLTGSAAHRLAIER